MGRNIDDSYTERKIELEFTQINFVKIFLVLVYQVTALPGVP